MRSILTAIISIITFSCAAQTYQERDFIKIPIPKDDSKEWHEYNLANHKLFSVKIVNGKLKIEQAINNNTKEYQIPTGSLVAVDAGEWGGGLYFKPNDDTHNTYEINGKQDTLNNRLPNYKIVIGHSSNVSLLKGKSVMLYGGNINTVFTYNDGLYFTTGLAHLSSNYGSLYSLKCQSNKFTTIKLVDLEGAPHAVAVYKDFILAATSNSFYIIKKWKKELVLDNLFWWGFNPSSIAVLDYNHVYVGMYGFYAKIDLEKKSMELYKFNK